MDSAELSPADKEKTRNIEQEVFLNIKAHVEKELNHSWDGEKKSNRLADFKIAQSIKKSFLNYESDRQRNDPKYFNF